MPVRGAAWRTATLSRLPLVSCTANRRLLEGFQTAHCNASPASISGNATFDHLQLLEETLKFVAGNQLTHRNPLMPTHTPERMLRRTGNTVNFFVALQ